MTRPLTPKQSAFVREYLIDLNATAAYKRAGYIAKGNAAEVNATRLLRNAQVKAEIQVLMNKRAQKVEITSDRVLMEIGKLAFADIRKIFDDQGRLLPVHMLPDEISASVSSVEVVTSKIPGTDPVEVEHVSKIKFWDKRASLELLGRHLKLFTDKIEVDIGADLATRMKEARERTQQG